jgi:hypothetical protein
VSDQVSPFTPKPTSRDLYFRLPRRPCPRGSIPLDSTQDSSGWMFSQVSRRAFRRPPDPVLGVGGEPHAPDAPDVVRLVREYRAALGAGVCMRAAIFLWLGADSRTVPW